uniref:Uncharacterized protein n=1 Tax=Siphoviridae sp. ctmpG14 TaxID=2825654 RepID=A0A8S5PB04_9CAUD|nr:MAG TPA: hypothetical protein [Siphoviridae sp. ctmpG14]
MYNNLVLKITCLNPKTTILKKLLPRLLIS